MSYLGDRYFGQTLRLKFTTVNASGVPTTLGNTPSLAYFVDGDTTLYTSGLTLSADYASKTGLNAVDVLVTTSCTGLAGGTDVQVIVAAGTVSGVSMIGYLVGEYSISKTSDLRPTTAARTLDVSAGGEAGVDWANVGSPTTAQNLSATTISTGQTVASMSDFSNAFTTAITEAYRANGAAPTMAQFMSEVLAHLGEAAIVGTTKTINKLDHSTAAETFTLDNAAAPTSITRAS